MWHAAFENVRRGGRMVEWKAACWNLGREETPHATWEHFA